MRDLNIFKNCKTAAVIVAHPDDETLWSGGTIMMNPQINWTILSLTRKSDHDRAPKFFNTMKKLNAVGFMADLDDEPSQKPLSTDIIQLEITFILDVHSYDIIITHHPLGEYTKHLRHEEISLAVSHLIQNKIFKCKKFLTFAYFDNEKEFLPKPRADADIIINLPEAIIIKKKEIITEVYGFSMNSFEAVLCTNLEAFKLQEIWK
jgi:hypothetical protein